MNKIDQVMQLLNEYNQSKESESKGINWYTYSNDKPPLGMNVLVKTKGGRIQYAVYSGEDEFDVNDPKLFSNYRNSWYKYSSKTFPYWYPLHFLNNK